MPAGALISRQLHDVTRKVFEFKKKDKLLTRAEFDAVFKSGMKFHRRDFILYLVKTAPGGYDKNRIETGPVRRIGLSVSVKVGNAVRRNLVKRRLREIFRKHRADIPPIGTGWDAVIVARSGIDRVKYADLEREVIESLTRAIAGRSKP